MDIALFSPSSLFAQDDDSSTDEENAEAQQKFVERNHQFPGMELLIREFTFHQLNANLLWPGSFAFAEWLVQHKSWIEGKRIIELGSGTGGLAIFLWKLFQIDITTSDYDDSEIEDNIAHNCKVNGVNPVLPHIKHVKQYNNLIKTLLFLLQTHKSNSDESVQRRNDRDNVEYTGAARPSFLMSWRRRIGKEEESIFFKGCENAGLEVQHLGSRVYCIKPREIEAKEIAQSC
ncbi:uncharacterized protein LOC108219533 isoform X2 [Daucus carota subsp. sativus]|uniref:uncharacterized protein LOC108219533 isoform X2 n=1 Tax=Daucus carota subsp. sativus TaxID=79200 RepID=UPI0007EF0FD9|nr:PREDICTED: uncharacterized protein LOC108219533 isoform X2 [Daucus carota subsp. sativus]